MTQRSTDRRKKTRRAATQSVVVVELPKSVRTAAVAARLLRMLGLRDSYVAAPEPHTGPDHCGDAACGDPQCRVLPFLALFRSPFPVEDCKFISKSGQMVLLHGSDCEMSRAASRGDTWMPPCARVQAGGVFEILDIEASR